MINVSEVEYFIAKPGAMSPQSYATSRAAAESRLAELVAEGNAGPWEIIPCDEFIARGEKVYLDRPATEVSAQDYEDALNVLPPLNWTHADGVERFCMSEFTSGRITTQYATRNGRFICKPVRYGDKSTYITAETFAALES